MASRSTTNESAYTNDESRWQAVEARDVAADGAFYYGVRSTGVYCRPSCPSRRPNRDQVVTFDTSEDARTAGFRACRRCYPDSVSADQLAVATVLKLIEASDVELTLGDLADEVGYSPSHLQRLFKRQTGLSPKQYGGALRQERFRKDLQDSETVTDAVYGAGFGSIRAAYEHATQLGMRPSVFRRGGLGERITYAISKSELGHFLVAATDRGICAVYLGKAEELVQQLMQEFSQAELREDRTTMAEHISTVEDAIGVESRNPGLRLDAHGSEFQQKVWAALREIPAGQTRTYGQIAEFIGQPTAARAVARACATNPLALLTPCHRVVRGDGGSGGYRWGIERKQELLRRERVMS